MADIAKTSIVSNENHNGLLADEQIENSPNNDSDMTECSEPNRTNNNCSNRNSCSSAVAAAGEGPKEGYQEIDSFSELSFRTTDDISLQDLIESEFQARISTINGDEFGAKDEPWNAPSTQSSIRTRDPFDDLFDKESTDQNNSSKDEFNISDLIEKNDIKDQLVTNLDDFISGPLKAEEEAEDGLITEPDYVKSPSDDQIVVDDGVNVFKRPNEIPIVSNFDPFARIEEDSDSNPISNPNVLNSPDEFPFPESPQRETKEWEKGLDKGKQNGGGSFPDSPQRETKEWDEGNQNGDEDVLPVDNDNIVKGLFCKTVSDENLDSFSDIQDNNGYSKFHVVNNMSSVESVNNSCPNMSTLTSPDRNDLDEIFPSERKLNDDEGSFEKEDEGKHIPDIIKDIPGNDDLEDQNEDQKMFTNETEEWTTVENALKNEDDCSVVTNQCVELDICVDKQTNDLGLTDLQANGLSSSDSETETRSESSSSDKKTIKKRKSSKKTKKSDEKENISVDVISNTPTTPSISLPPIQIDDSEDLANVSVKNLMQTYCTEASKSFQNQLCDKEIVPSPVPIQNLKARSMMDLSTSNKVAVLRSNLFENGRNVETSRSTNNLSNVERSPVVTGVSVRALKERYCSMINLNDRIIVGDVTPPERRRRISVPWSEALKSSFSKFDQLSKKTVLHVRSVDASKVQKQFNEATTVSGETTSNCKSCGKQVFQMEQIKAEKAVWHKNCFRCKECNKQLTVDTYSSHEGILYCKPHFKELFKPKAVLEDETEPASDKPDLGLEELSSLNVRQRYQVFEKTEEVTNGLDKSPSAINVKRSPSILSKLAKFQKKGMDIGVTDDSLNGIPQCQSSTSSEEEEDEEEPEENTNGRKVIKSKKLREKPISFGKMEDVKSVWENGVAKTKEELREERKQEIQQIRSRLFMGKQVKMKEAYEQAVRESESSSPRKSIDVRCEKAKSIKECFEKGEPLNVDDEEDGDDRKKTVEDDMSLFEAGISKKSRSLFLELDKSAKNQQTSQVPPKSTPRTPVTPPIRKEVNVTASPSLDDVVRSSDTVEDVHVETADISSKFKFFETYKEPEKEKKRFRITPPREGQVKTESPEREVYRDPNVVRSTDKVEQEIMRTNTTAKMLSLFRQMEEKTEEIPEGPKPLKRFTPPPDYKEESEDASEDESEEESEEEEDEEEETNPNLVRASDKIEDEYLKQAANAARAKQLRAKFEKWEEKEKEREREELRERQMNGSTNNTIVDNSENVEVTSIECTKSLRARFESMKNEAEQPKEKLTRPKVNRFVEIQNNMAETCDVCNSRVYQLEKIETSGKIFHKSCFRCVQCNCLLRMESFTLNCGRLYCLPHFKQLFIAKGNYDEGFGVDQHKTKWSTVASF